eukprot:6832785-Prymnesium_polylepis.2
MQRWRIENEHVRRQMLTMRRHEGGEPRVVPGVRALVQARGVSLPHRSAEVCPCAIAHVGIRLLWHADAQRRVLLGDGLIGHVWCFRQRCELVGRQRLAVSGSCSRSSRIVLGTAALQVVACGAVPTTRQLAARLSQLHVVPRTERNEYSWLVRGAVCCQLVPDTGGSAQQGGGLLDGFREAVPADLGWPRHGSVARAGSVHGCQRVPHLDGDAVSDDDERPLAQPSHAVRHVEPLAARARSEPPLLDALCVAMPLTAVAPRTFLFPVRLTLADDQLPHAHVVKGCHVVGDLLVLRRPRAGKEVVAALVTPPAGLRAQACAVELSGLGDEGPRGG